MVPPSDHLPAPPTPPGDHLPTLGELIEGVLGIRLPALRLPQVAKNTGKALGRIINAGGSAISRAIERDTERRDARHNAKLALDGLAKRTIDKTMARDRPELVDRALDAALGRAVEEQERLENVARVALEDLEAQPPTEDATQDLDDDWLTDFTRIAAQKSKEEVQKLWGKLLANEIRRPGSFKLRNLHALSMVDAGEAKLIHDSFRYVVDNLAVFGGSSNQLISIPDVLELAALGVISESDKSLTFIVEPDNPARVWLTPNFILQIQSEKRESVSLGNVYPLTSFGRELRELGPVQQPPPPELINEMLRYLRQDGRKFALLAVNRNPGDQQVYIQHSMDLPVPST